MSVLFFSAAPFLRERRARRAALVLSLVVHLAGNALLLAWGPAPWPTEGPAPALSRGGFVLVSLVDRAPGAGAAAPAEPAAAAGRAASTFDPTEPAAKEIAAPAAPAPFAERSATAETPARSESAEGTGSVSGPSAGDGLPGDSGTAPTGTAGTGTGTGAPAYRPPRLLVGALPLAPADGPPGMPEITARLLVGVDGRVSRVEPETDLPPPVREALLESARAMRFVPARRGADAVPAWFPMTFTFHR